MPFIWWLKQIIDENTVMHWFPVNYMLILSDTEMSFEPLWLIYLCCQNFAFTCIWHGSPLLSFAKYSPSYSCVLYKKLQSVSLYKLLVNQRYLSNTSIIQHQVVSNAYNMHIMSICLYSSSNVLEQSF